LTQQAKGVESLIHRVGAFKIAGVSVGKVIAVACFNHSNSLFSHQPLLFDEFLNCIFVNIDSFFFQSPFQFLRVFLGLFPQLNYSL